MTLDLLSIIVGGILWEIISAYIHFVAAPRFRRYQEKKKGAVDERLNRKIREDYCTTTMGFNCKLKK